MTKRLRRRVRAEVAPGFRWTDPERGHVIACGDATDVSLLTELLVEQPGEGSAFDLVLADPPYAVSNVRQKINLKGRKDMFLREPWDLLSFEELEDLLLRLCSAAARVASAGNVWVWTSDWFVSVLKRDLRDLALRVWPTYVWCKSNPPFQVRKTNPASACEFLVMASAPGNFFDLAALPRQRNWFVAAPDGGADYAPAVSPYWVERPVVHAAERLRRAGEREYINRAQKPLDVITDLVRAGAPEDGLVLDLCGGTGTTLVAADRMGRRCVYVDADPVQVRAAAKRLIEDRRRR